MQRNALPSPTGVDWKTFHAHLADYVRLELAGEAAEAIYPEIAFYITAFPECEAAYDREFRSQGLRKTIPELQQLGQREETTTVMQHIGAATKPEPVLTPDPNWVEVALNEGRAWLERGTQRWRQLLLALPAFPSGQASAPALAGLMNANPTTSSPLGSSYIAPAKANFELRLAVSSDAIVGKEGLCQLEVTVTLHERFGDFSGVLITLLWGNAAQQQTTNALGKVTFRELPSEQLSTMHLLVTLPDSP